MLELDADPALLEAMEANYCAKEAEADPYMKVPACALCLPCP